MTLRFTANNFQGKGNEVYFAAYGSCIQQEAGTQNKIPLPVKKGNNENYSSAWQLANDLTIPIDFLRISSTNTANTRLNQSRITLVPTKDGIPTNLYIAESIAHKKNLFNKSILARTSESKKHLTASIIALKGREDICNQEECKKGASKGDDHIMYVIAEDFEQSAKKSSNRDILIKKFNVAGKIFTARYNCNTVKEETIKNFALWLIAHNGKAIVMTALPANLLDKSERQNVLKQESYKGNSVTGLKQRSLSYYQNLPQTTQKTHQAYMSIFEPS